MLNDLIVSACARPAFVARFWSRVDKSGECWEWTALRNTGGYGRIFVGRCRVTHKNHVTIAPRVSWTMAHGRIPEGLCVCHKCDNPPCVNPAHLFLGTQGENARDCASKRRHHHGERHRFSKLTDEDVRRIRELSAVRPQTKIARDYGISQGHVSEIVAGKIRKSA